MGNFTRRNFLTKSILALGTVTISSTFNKYLNLFAKTENDLIFKPNPHPWMPKIDFAYLTDEQEDPFLSNTKVSNEGIIVPKELGKKRFSLNTRWFVEGFGYIMLTADNGGELYSIKDFNSGRCFNLNYEFAKSRIIRNRKVKLNYKKTGIAFSPEVEYLLALSEELFESATKKINDEKQCSDFSDKALLYALHAGEKMEIEKARYEIEKNKRIDKVYFGCETRQYVWAKSEDFVKRFTEIFNYATITHYVWDTWYELFEPEEGVYNWGIKDNIVNWLLKNNITIEGRPLFWFHPTVTPEWLKSKNFEQLKKYMDKHIYDLVTHYGNNVLHWEVFNEYHDWANIHNHTEAEILELTKFAFDKTKEVNPKVVTILNNCYPWAEYVARGRMARMDATRPLRSPRKYIEDMINGGVDFDVLGIQIYFPNRDLSDIVRLLERFEKFNKPIYITEIGATSGGINPYTLQPLKDFNLPYDWHRQWDEELQADWLEQVYTICYSRPSIKAINWYDFSDFRPFIINGGLVREDSSPKMSFYRLKELLEKWEILR
ncbi:endo-1,4-beta-xylanase [Ignavibacteria bacterium 4148-Me]|uniref:endo-1,4-beta-xylanase n=1 Tax=Rosettibacter primus TaxID=3111523 RepID=UPI00336BC5D7